MANILSYLGISQSIQQMFSGFFHIGEKSNIFFPYENNKVEIFSLKKHSIPRQAMPWKASKVHFSNITDVYLFESAIEAICFAQYKHSLTASWNIDNSIFLSLGKQPSSLSLNWVIDNFKNKYFHFVFPNTVLGKVMDCKMAALISNKTIKFSHYNEHVYADYKGEVYGFMDDKFSLAVLRKITGIQNRIGKTEKAPLQFQSFKDYQTSRNPKFQY